MRFARPVSAGLDTKLKEIKKKARYALASYFSKKVRECDERISDYERRLREAPHFRGLMAIEESKKRAFKREMDSELR